MKARIEAIEDCLETMRGCLKYPEVQSCVCYYQAFMVLQRELKECEAELDCLDQEVSNRLEGRGMK